MMHGPINIRSVPVLLDVVLSSVRSINSKRQVLHCVTIACSERTDCCIALFVCVCSFTDTWYTGCIFIIL